MTFFFQSSPWWIFVCLLVGAVYAFAMYQPLPRLVGSGATVGGFDKRTTYGLAALRFVVVSFLCFLLLNPLIRSLRTLTEKPKVVLAVDNSESVAAAGRPALNKALTGLQTLRQQLTDKGLDVTVRTFGDSITDADLTQIPFTRRTTDLSALLSGIRSDYEGRNLTDVVLVSDGIVNQGVSPTFGQYPFAVQTIGLGDTIPKKDIQLKGIVANRIAYLGNQFPVQAEVVSNGFQGRTATVVLRQNGKELGRQSINFGKNDTFNQLTFQATATQKGVQHYVVDVLPQPGEFSTLNNRQDVYLDVIDGKEKVLLLALAPHPDIKAIRNILERNQNYELDIRILTGTPAEATASADRPPADKTYDLIILHQIPDNGGIGNPVIQRYLAKNTPVLFVLGNQSALGPFNTSNPVIQVAAQPNQSDKVTGVFNPEFKQLNFDPAKLDILSKLPPLLTPYGDYRLQPGSEVVLWQQVGSIRTTKPLLALNVTSPRKTAVLAGEGIWAWRLEEYALTDKQEVVDELIQKVIQLISVKEDRRKLRVYPIRNEFIAGEKVIFETELYNDIYERLYDKPVRLEIKDEKGVTRSFNYTPTASNSRFEISRLPEGAYSFKATVTVNNKAEQSSGQFVVRDLQLEALNTTADHGMLRQLAQQTGGQFFTANQTDELVRKLTAQSHPARLTSTEEMNELINWRWLFFVVLTLAAIEWGLRKFYGGY
ncbi:VWA domain-containing protein [Spirosoma sp. KCTC 42546]|uniref:VWA domain-containing protein n=1 Tax=Spirosoma sp. KCTC 42546 TaxID=2520506 RepID=UPI00115AE72D|nr:VWA domain-containing protein [Spirosoma sp. KCTC 42546]QDK79234.1 VWA domain-containing protein [Spirosoma sp. KCTC 42546]